MDDHGALAPQFQRYLNTLGRDRFQSDRRISNKHPVASDHFVCKEG